MSDVRRQLQYKLVLNHGIGEGRGGTYIAASATWLQLPFAELGWLLDVMYERVGEVPAEVEAHRLATLG